MKIMIEAECPINRPNWPDGAKCLTQKSERSGF